MSTRLQAELQRLFLPDTTGNAHPGTTPDTTRAVVLEVARPADWQRLSAVWRGVQADLDLPAPAIAVNGLDGMQLWFSLSEAVGAAQALDFVKALIHRYLPDVPARQLRWMTAADAPPVPAPRTTTTSGDSADSGNGWSAYVAQDLAPLFAETPWLDIAPGDDGQAQVLSALASIQPAAFKAAVQRLKTDEDEATATAALKAAGGRPADGSVSGDAGAAAVAPTQTRSYGAGLDPKQFLLAVMGDNSAPLALRVDAAKALLPYTVAATVTATVAGSDTRAG